MRSDWRFRRTAWFWAALLVLFTSAPALAAEAKGSVVPGPLTLPPMLSMQEALRLLRERGLDLLIADAAVRSAGADAQTAAAIYNPNLIFGAGTLLNWSATSTPSSPCSGCTLWGLSWGLGDNGALMDVASGKRRLRVDVAQAALQAAKLSRADAQRVIESQLKQQYVQVVVSQATIDFNRVLQAAMNQLLELNRLRYPKVITEADLARVEVQKLEADQAVATARQALRQAQVGLAFLLGVRDTIPDFQVDLDAIKLRSRPTLATTTEEALLERAFATRPDLKGMGYQRVRAQAALMLARRQRLPDIDLSLSWGQWGVGPGAASPAVLSANATLNLPIFYQQQGEIRRALADRATKDLTYAKTLSQVVSDLDTAFIAYQASYRMAQRMETTILGRARTARDILEYQYKKGAATLMDFLDAERTYITTNLEYLQDLAAYWTAVYQLEQAVGAELP